jgi:hypothetical protein
MTRTSGCAVGIVAGVLVLAAACAPRESGALLGGTEAPPDSITNPLAAEQRAAVLEYARRLKFDSLPHGARDRQRLTTRDSITRREVLGPIAELLPERHSRRNEWPALERGRIVARITTDGRYASLGLPVGVSYVWIDSLRRSDYTGRAIVIPVDSSVPARRLDVLYLRDPYAGHGREPAARWVYVEGRSEIPWLTCVTNGCCLVGVRSAEGISLDSERY